MSACASSSAISRAAVFFLAFKFTSQSDLQETKGALGAQDFSWTALAPALRLPGGDTQHVGRTPGRRIAGRPPANSAAARGLSRRQYALRLAEARTDLERGG